MPIVASSRRRAAFLTSSIERSKVCYKKIMPPQPKKARATKVKEDRGSMDDWDYEVPGQMELSDFIEMPEGGNDDD